MKSVLVFLSIFSFLSLSSAEETPAEKANVEMNAVGQKTKKVIHRTEEAVCGTLTGDNKIECLAKKGKHRLKEGADAITGKASEIKGQVESK